MTRQKNILLLIFFLLSSTSLWPVFAQEKIDADQLFKQARTLAFEGKRQEARELCLKILQQSPNYTDVRILLGRLYSWDAQYPQARAELLTAVNEKPAYLDGLLAIIDLELWTGNANTALKHCQDGLAIAPNNETLLFKQSKAYQQLGDKKAAMAIVKGLLATNPNNSEARNLKESLQPTELRNMIKLEYTYDNFDKSFEPWNSVALSLTKKTSVGTFIGRLNYARRFEINGVQVEVDAYPKVTEGRYFYLNFGYSSSSIFPEYRAGVEFYNRLGRGFEASMGLRHLRFDRDDVTIYTGSLGKYYKNYFFSFRPYITPGSVGTSFSGFGAMRRYFKDESSYLSITMGAGSTPDQRVTNLDLFRLNSQKLIVEGHKKINKNLVGVGAFEFENQELPRNNGSRKKYTVRIGFETSF